MANIASDAFAGSDGTVLSTYDSSWTKVVSDSASKISNAGRVYGGAGASRYEHSATPGSADYSVAVDVYVMSTGDSGAAGPMGRAAVSGPTFYMARTVQGSGYQAFKCIAGSYTQLGSTSTKTFTAGNTYNVKLEMVGTAIKAYSEGSASAYVSVTDSAISATNKPGLYIYSGGTPSNTVGHHLDNWTADESGGTTTALVLPDAAQAQSADAVVLTTASSLAVADATHAHSAETPTLDASTATPLTVADATQAQSSDAGTLTTASSIAVADAAQAQSVEAADLTSLHSLAVADASQAQASEVPTLDTSNATPLTIADATQGHTVDNLALLAACLLSVADASQTQQSDSLDLSTLRHLAVADATQAISSESPTLTIPGAGTGATVEEIVAALQAAVLPVNITQVNSTPLAGVGSDADPWRAA